MGGGQEKLQQVGSGYAEGSNVVQGLRNYAGTSRAAEHRRRIKQNADTIDALKRLISVKDLTQPPDYLGDKYQPNYVLPAYPTNTMPEEDVRIAF